MIDYSIVYTKVDEFLQTREGLACPKNKQDYNLFLRELTGIFCGVAHENYLKTNDVVAYLEMVKHHEIQDINTTGELLPIGDLISLDVRNHPLYKLTEYILMYYKPGNVQVGPGEFFFCFYDRGSVFGIDNTAGYDVVTDGVPTEFKKLGSNFTDPELFDKYAASEDVDRLLVVKPVSNAKRPQIRSYYSCTDTTNWRNVFHHTGKNGTLGLIR